MEIYWAVKNAMWRYYHVDGISGIKLIHLIIEDFNYSVMDNEDYLKQALIAIHEFVITYNMEIPMELKYQMKELGIL